LTHSGEQRDQKDQFKAVAFYGLHKAGNGILVQRVQFLAYHLGQGAFVSGIGLQIAQRDSLSYNLVQHTMNNLDGLWRQSGFAVLLFPQAVVKPLYCMRI